MTRAIHGLRAAKRGVPVLRDAPCRIIDHRIHAYKGDFMIYFDKDVEPANDIVVLRMLDGDTLFS